MENRISDKIESKKPSKAQNSKDLQTLKDLKALKASQVEKKTQTPTNLLNNLNKLMTQKNDKIKEAFNEALKELNNTNGKKITKGKEETKKLNGNMGLSQELGLKAKGNALKSNNLVDAKGSLVANKNALETKQTNLKTELPNEEVLKAKNENRRGEGVLKEDLRAKGPTALNEKSNFSRESIKTEMPSKDSKYLTAKDTILNNKKEETQVINHQKKLCKTSYENSSKVVTKAELSIAPKNLEKGIGSGVQSKIETPNKIQSKISSVAIQESNTLNTSQAKVKDSLKTNKNEASKGLSNQKLSISSSKEDNKEGLQAGKVEKRDVKKLEMKEANHSKEAGESKHFSNVADFDLSEEELLEENFQEPGITGRTNINSEIKRGNVVSEQEFLNAEDELEFILEHAYSQQIPGMKQESLPVENKAMTSASSHEKQTEQKQVSQVGAQDSKMGNDNKLRPAAQRKQAYYESSSAKLLTTASENTANLVNQNNDSVDSTRPLTLLRSITEHLIANQAVHEKTSSVEVKHHFGTEGASNESTMHSNLKQNLQETVYKVATGEAVTSPLFTNEGKLNNNNKAADFANNHFAYTRDNNRQSNKERNANDEQSKNAFLVDQVETRTSRQEMAQLFESTATTNVQHSEIIPSIIQQLERVKKTDKEWFRLSIPNTEGKELSVFMRMANNTVQIRFQTESEDLKNDLLNGWNTLQTAAKNKGIAVASPEFSNAELTLNA